MTDKTIDSITVKPIKHGFDGACIPNGDHAMGYATFSVGIFPLILKADGKDYKRGKVLVRVRGLTSDPERVKATAHRIVAELGAGSYLGPKQVNV